MPRVAFLIAVALALSSAAQTKPENTKSAAGGSDHEVLVIVRYVSTGVIARDRVVQAEPEDFGPGEMPLLGRVYGSYCAIVYTDGFFQFQPQGLGFQQQREILKGYLPINRMSRLRELLRSRGFRDLKGHDRYTAGFVHRSTETLDARVNTSAGMQRLRWINPEDRRPMPEPAQHLLDWIASQRWERYGRQVRSTQPLCPHTVEPADRDSEVAVR